MTMVTVTCATCTGSGSQFAIVEEEYDDDGFVVREITERVDCDDCDGEGSWEEAEEDFAHSLLGMPLGPKLAAIDAAGYTADHLTAPGHDPAGCPWYCPVSYPRDYP